MNKVQDAAKGHESTYIVKAMCVCDRERAITADEEHLASGRRDALTHI